MVDFPWTQGHLRIHKDVMTSVERAGIEAYGRDEEACGYLVGPVSDGLLVDEAVELENLANKYHRVDPEGHPRTGREYFKINGVRFEKAIERARNEERAVKVFFHSHLDCGAYFSEEDAASMTMGGASGPIYQLAYLVTAVDQGRATDHKLFIWDEGTRTFVATPFAIVE